MPLIIYNPKSRVGTRQKKMRQFLSDNDQPESGTVLVDVTQEKDMRSRLLNHPKDDAVYLLGGDGTLNHFIHETIDLHPLPFPIHVIPFGSGNDFARSLKKESPDATHIYEVTTQEGPRYFLNGMGIGIDGAIGEKVNQTAKKRPWTYLFETIKALVTYTPQTVEVTLDGTKHTFHKTYLAVASNGQYFGSGMRISPDASLHDESLDVIVVHAISRLKILLIFLSIYAGLHLKFKRHVFHAKASRIAIQQTQPGVLQTDGETWPNQTELSISITDKKTAFRL